MTGDVSPATGRPILVVDDRAAERTAIAAALEPLGHTIVECGSGAEALARLNTGDFGLILLDARMPGMDGPEVAVHIRRQDRLRDVPIVFLTGAAGEADLWRGYEAGATDYVVKPFSAEVLRAKVSRYLELAPRMVPQRPQPDGAARPLPILVVDDEPANLRAFRAALEDLSEETVTVPSGPDALRALLERDFAVALVDVSMAGQDGFDLVAEIRRRPRTRSLPIVFVSALRQAAADVERGYALGAVDFVFTPCPAAILRAKVAVFLELHRRRLAVERQAADLEWAVACRSAELHKEIADRQAAEAKARRFAQRLEHLLATMPVVVYASAANDGFVPTFISSSMHRVFGWDSAAALGDAAFWADRVHPDDRAAALADRMRVLDRGETACEYRFRHADGTYRWVHDSARFVRNDVDGPEIVGSLIDVTAQRNLEAQLRQSQKMEAVGLMAGGLAHDFNNLLTAILGYTSLVAEEVSAPKVLADLAEMRKAGERAAEMTRRLLAFSRKQVLTPSRVDLNTVVTALIAVLHRLIREDIQIDTRLAPSPVYAFVDPTQMEQVILNLVLNARDAMPRGGRLTIETGTRPLPEADAQRHGIPPGTYQVMRISDTGVGMTEETMQRIFEPFFTTKPREQGTGLGLSTVYGIVRQSGGAVLVRSTPGAGTTFDVCLPAADDTVGAEAPPPAPPPSGSLDGHETVLLLDDDAMVRRFAGNVLRRHGYTVLEAGTGDDAFELAAAVTDPIDALVSDVVLPGASGPESAARLIAARPALRVLYMSGYTPEATAPVFNSGVVPPILQKPFNATDLLRAVRALFEAGRV